MSVLSNGDDDGGLSNSKKYLDGVGVVLLYIFLNFGFQCHRFFSTFALFSVKKSRTHARVSSHSRGERRQRLVHATRIIAIDA